VGDFWVQREGKADLGICEAYGKSNQDILSHPLADHHHASWVDTGDALASRSEILRPGIPRSAPGTLDSQQGARHEDI
jgi:hypothetical protein